MAEITVSIPCDGLTHLINVPFIARGYRLNNTSQSIAQLLSADGSVALQADANSQRQGGLARGSQAFYGQSVIALTGQSFIVTLSDATLAEQGSAGPSAVQQQIYNQVTTIGNQQVNISRGQARYGSFIILNQFAGANNISIIGFLGGFNTGLLSANITAQFNAIGITLGQGAFSVTAGSFFLQAVYALPMPSGGIQIVPQNFPTLIDGFMTA